MHKPRQVDKHKHTHICHLHRHGPMRAHTHTHTHTPDKSLHLIPTPHFISIHIQFNAHTHVHTAPVNTAHFILSATWANTNNILLQITWTHTHKSASTWSTLRWKEHKQKTDYAHVHTYMNADTFMQTRTHTHTGAIKACFMTLMNGFWLLYPFRWVQKWGIVGRRTHTHTNIALAYKRTSTDISTLHHTRAIVACMHAEMYKYTRRDPVSLPGEAQSLLWLIGVVWLPLFTSYYLCAEAGKISKQSAYMTLTRKTPWPSSPSLHTVWVW